jgi:hypothetical protein
MSKLAPLTRDEVKQVVEDWYQKLDVHAPMVEVLPMLAEEGLEMRFPEATLRSLAEFEGWYQGVIRIFFDEVHTLQTLEIALNADQSQADIKLVVYWEASRWNPPAAKSERLMMDAAQTWVVRRSPTSGKPVIVIYTVDGLTLREGSVPL